MDAIMIKPRELAQVYVPFFIEDFTNDVMNHLSGSYPLPVEDIRAFVSKAVGKLVTDSQNVVIDGASSIARFLYECAEHAIEHSVGDVESRETYERIAVLPSVHHTELNRLVYVTAALYRKTLEDTLVGTVMQDAMTAARTIAQAAAARTATTETGGELKFFSWGILNNGSWLNAALLKAQSEANIFKPGMPVVTMFAKTAFDFARGKTFTERYDEETVTAAYGEIDTILAHTGRDDIDDMLAAVAESTNLNALLYTPGYLANEFNRWEYAQYDPADLIAKITTLTNVTNLLVVLQQTLQAMDDDTLISDLTRNRIAALNDVVTLTLVAYEALRETKFAKTLIMKVEAQGNDPTVSVYINSDLINAYRSSGGDDANLIHFGLYLDPRRGTSVPGDGWSLNFVNVRTAEVVPQMIAQDTDRLEALRRNDAAVIQAEALRVVRGLADSYVQASKHDTLRNDIAIGINTLSRRLTSDEVISAEEEIAKLLVSIIDDQHVTAMANTLFGFLSSPSEYQRENAVPLTIAQTAINDSYNWIVTGIPAE